jgi:hypothetical protein
MGDDLVVVDGYNLTERRERGGMAEFEINFIEAGESPAMSSTADTQSASNNAAQNLISQSQLSAVDVLTPTDR